jgi:hypothetical protein
MWLRCDSTRRREGRRLGFLDGLDVSSVHDNVVAVILISQPLLGFLRGRHVLSKHEISSLNDIEHGSTPKLYAAPIKIQQRVALTNCKYGITKLRRFVDFILIASAAVSLSHLPLKFPLSPTRIFARWI